MNEKTCNYVIVIFTSVEILSLSITDLLIISATSIWLFVLLSKLVPLLVHLLLLLLQVVLLELLQERPLLVFLFLSNKTLD